MKNKMLIFADSVIESPNACLRWDRECITLAVSCGQRFSPCVTCASFPLGLMSDLPSVL